MIDDILKNGEITVSNELLNRILDHMEQQLMVNLSQVNYFEDLESTSLALIQYLTKCKDNIHTYMKKDSSITLIAENTKQELEKQVDIFFHNIEKLLEVKELSNHTALRMHEIHDSNEEIVNKLHNALSFLNKISKSTNVLSINSSIEAARLGEAGQPFRIISKEVQKLSIITSNSTADMTGSTEKIKEQSSEMGKMLNHTNTMIEQSVSELMGAKSGFSVMHEETEAIVKESLVLDDVMQSSLDLIEKTLLMLEYNKVSYLNIKKTMLQQVQQLESSIAELKGILDIKEQANAFTNYKQTQESFYKYFKNENKEMCMKTLEEGLQAGVSAELLLTQIVERSVEKLGKEQIDRDVPLSEIYINGRIIEESLDLLLPLIPINNKKYIGKIVIGNAFGDYHALGRQIVTTFLKLAGFDVLDLGLSVHNEDFVKAVKEHNAELVCVSALIIHTAKEVKELRNLMNRNGLQHIKILVGGAPFNFEPRLVREVSADGMARNAVEAIRVAKEMIGLLDKEVDLY